MMKFDIIDEVYAYCRYENDQIFVIDEDGKDHKVRDLFSYSSWLENWSNHSIKVEGLEDTDIGKRINFSHKIKNIHLFINNVGGVSFKEHKDDIDVYLHVDTGKKYVHMNDDVYTVSKGEGIYIPKGVMHKVDSEPGTWALSIGYNNE